MPRDDVSLLITIRRYATRNKLGCSGLSLSTPAWFIATAIDQLDISWPSEEVYRTTKRRDLNISERESPAARVAPKLLDSSKGRSG